jgi:hypothetical protein
MAKKKINDYIFHTGIPYSENRYPNAYWLIQNNVEFIKDEVRAYINSEIAIAAQYNVTGATYTPTDHTMVLTIGTHALTVGSFIKLATDSLTFTPALTIDYTDIFLVKAITADSITIDVPTSDVTARTFSSANANAVINVFYNYTNDSNDKCERDMGYNLIGGDIRNPVQDQPGGLLYDLRYGGNEQARYLASTYWDGALPQIDGDRNPERAAKEFCAWLIKTYILDNVAYTTKQSPAETTQTINTEYVAETEADAVVDKVLTETIGEVIYFGTPNMPAFENAKISRVLFPSKVKQENLLLITDTTNNVVLFNFSDPTTGAETKYTEESIEFTPTYEYFQKFLENTDNITQVLFDKTTENEEFLKNARNLLTQNKEFIKDEVRAWIADQVANAGSGSIWSGYTYNAAKCERDTGFNIDAIIKDMQYGGNDNVRSTAAKYWKGPTPQIDGSREQEIAAKNFMRDLVNNYILTKAVYPTKQGGSPETTQYFLGGTAELGGDTRVTELVAILTTVIKEGLSKLPPLDKPQIFHDTDKLQIFVDQGDLKVRPYDFGTDAIERQRVANSLSMLDADFEYGLQPTKWQAIGTMRGYPSTYEVPGTDTSVLSVVTDASTGSQGVGQSLITVTSVGPHGFEAGKPITIRGLDGSVAGNGRAEGTFIVNTVPTTTTFTYYAKAKVGTSAGTTLHTFYTILRGADFYTGATIQGDTPSFEVTTQGSNGSFSLALGALSGENRLTTQQSPPNLGAPLQTAGGEIPLGSQVTGTVGTGGITTTPVTTADTPQGSFTIDVQDASAVTVGTGLDRGDGFAAFVTQVSGNTLTLSEATTRVLVGNTVTYTGVTGTNDNSIGNGASFDVVRTNGVYNTTLNSGGQDYQVGDNILIDGGQVGGASGTNDIRILVDTVDTGGEILTFTETGVGFDGNGTFFDRTGTLQGGIGTTPVFDVTYTNNVYSVSVASPDTSGGYVVGDQIKIDGFELGGQSVTNDVIIKVEAVGTGGGITTVSATGTAVDADVTYSSPSYTTTTVSGVDADFNIQRIGTAYTVFITNAGTGYLAGESFTILGSALGGVDGVNNLTITIATVDTGGEILTVNTSGTAVNTKTYGYVTTGSNYIGSGAEFQVDLASGAYTVTVQSAGSQYGVDQEIVIQGTEMSGTSPANDITITITSVNASDGGISGISFTGTGATGSGNYTAVIGNNDPNSGADAVFDVTRTGGAYSLVVATNDGAGYKVGDRIIIPGDQLGGATPTNDLTLRCTVESTEGDFVGIDVTGTAVSGDVLDLYSSVTMSEQTTGQINQSTVITYSALASIRVTFATPHGLVPGDAFAVTISSDDGANNHALAAGPFSATAVPSNVQLEYQCRSPGFLDTTSDQQITGNVYPRPDSFFIHRPYDGGVQLGTGGPQHGSQAIRQSKKYIRYQSGKGIMYTTGALFAPSYNILNITADATSIGSTITVTTDETEHGLQVGGGIRIIGVDTVGYNGNYTVSAVNDENEFEIIAISALGSTTPELSSECQVSLRTFHGATVRSGAFDDQNGIFFEYDGTQFSAVQRTATLQLAGVVDVDVDSNTVTGTGTRFREQLKAGDRIVLKGMTHVVTQVDSNTTMYLAPDFRGVTDVRASKLCLIRDKKTEQEDFNLDRMDGTGPSGYNLDISKMQMVGIQYSWYGAGFIDYMLRGADGNFVFCHRMRNSNINTEAFMRTGNMPVRYEITNEGPNGKLAEDISDSSTVIPLQDASFFPPEGGTVYIDAEMIRFTGIDGKNLIGLTRSSSMTNFAAGATRTYTGGPAAAHTRNTGVVLVSNTASPNISHWGSAFITDGGFDSDRGYLFSYKSTGTNVTTTRNTSFLLRLAPSVSNALVGDLGERELLNRAQLLLEGLEITTDPPASSDTGGIIVEGILNPQNYPANPDDIGWQGLSGLAQGGQPSFAQIAPGGSVNWNSGAVATTSQVTTQAPITANIIAKDRGYRGGNSYWDNGLTSGRNRFFVLDSFYQSNQALFETGVEVQSQSGNYFPSGTTITSVSSYTWSTNGLGNVRHVFTSSSPTSNVTGDVPLVFTKTFKGAPTNNIYFEKSDYDSAGVVQGTTVSDSRFPAGTQVSTVSLKTYGSTEYYDVTFNQASDATAITAGTTDIEFEFVQPPYAQPGETIFSFIAQPGERSTLDLAFIKELTNTTLGGRGTFPNGPDVLAINVYKTSGAAITANLVLRWSEAQA